MKKSFNEYYTESKKVYEFCLKLSNIEPTSELVGRIKSALGAYSLADFSKPKRLPIQEHRDFPALGPCECHIIDFAVEYPAITEQLISNIVVSAGISRSNFSLRTRAEYDQTMAAESAGKDHEGALLTDPELKDVAGAQEQVGQKKTDSMLKDFVTRKYEFAAKSPADGKTLRDIPTQDVSPVGSRQNNIPNPIKGKK